MPAHILFWFALCTLFSASLLLHGLSQGRLMALEESEDPVSQTNVKLICPFLPNTASSSNSMEVGFEVTTKALARQW